MKPEVVRTPRTGAQKIWDVLVEQGVEVVFGYPGGAILPAYDALPDSPIRHVLVRHEQGAAHMADGYARASGKVGVAVATSGPGATNLVTGIATAMMDSSPIVCITGQVASPMLGKDAFQEADVIGVTMPVTKHNFLVRRAEDIAPMLREAFRLAQSGRPGPVLVDITKDAQQQTIAPAGDDPQDKRPSLLRPVDIQPREDILRAARLINAAKRPVLLAGHGIILSGASEEVHAFAERAQIPVAQTLLALGAFPAGHPLCLGMMGMHGESWVNQAIQASDLLISFGMRFDDRVTGKLETYAKAAQKIHIDIDPAEINKVVEVDVGLVGDLREVLLQLLPEIAAADRRPWLRHIEGLKGDSAVRDIAQLPDNGHLYAAHVISDLWRITEGRAVVCTDVGQHQMWAAQYYRHRTPRSSITSGGLGTMGFALPAAIGAKFARPESEVWVIAGDGGFQMTAAELSTCAQEKLNLNIAIINNGYLGMVRQWQEFFYARRYAATPILSPDFVKLADAHGLEGIRVTRREDVEDAVARARASSQTVVVDFRVEQEDSVFPMVATGSDLDDMIRRPDPKGAHNAIYETGDDE
ncbi:MAG: biosynthetic-type acetolactate synthase large subunit [Deltaproteobacteria bacterium]|nr:biosynthetic-type acetolactate synthase large subunit [Deltaproteobacteria bacterium]